MSKYKFDEKEHVHLLDKNEDGNYAPLKGTTTIIKEVYPPPLAWYGAGKALEALGFITEKKEPDKAKRKELAEKGQEEAERAVLMHIDEYMKWLDYQYRTHDRYKKERGKVGTDTHGLIENYIKYCIETNGGKPTKDVIWEGIEKFVEWSEAEVDRFLWSEAHCYSEKLWVGGICDFGFVHKNGKVIVGDAKPAMYPTHFIQTAGYALQIEENGIYGADGTPIKKGVEEKIGGFCIFDYVKGKPYYLSGDWIEELKSDFIHTVKMYDRKDLIGDNKLQ